MLASTFDDITAEEGFIGQAGESAGDFIDDSELDEQSELYEHHRCGCDKGQPLRRVDKYLFIIL